jgi:NADH-quinone oxidoreductase subunit N
MSFNCTLLSLAAPEIFIFVMLVLMLVFDMLLPRAQALLYCCSQITLIFAAIVTTWQYCLYSGSLVVFDGHYLIDSLGLLLKLVIYILSILALSYSRCPLLGEKLKNELAASNEYYLLVLFAVLGMSVMCMAASMLAIYLGIELLSLALYTMIALGHKHQNPAYQHAALEAAIKYFILGSLASAIFLYGTSILYGITGSINLHELAYNVDIINDKAAIMVLSLVLLALLTKFAVVPVHMWLPDVYQGTPNKIAVFITTVPKIAIFAVLMRILMELLPNLTTAWVPIILFMALLSMVLGNLLAIAQSNIKRMLAYSAIAHTGYLLIGLVIGSDLFYGYDAALCYLLVYTLVAIGAFGVLAILSNQNFDLANLNDLRGLNTRSPWLAFMMLIFMFSLAGVPPTAGFFAKLGLLITVIQQNHIWLAATMLLVALIGAYYYLRVVMLMYFSAPTTTANKIKLSWSSAVVVSANGFAALALGIWPNSIIKLCRTMLS